MILIFKIKDMKSKLLLFMACFLMANLLGAKDVKISVMPSDAKIYIDGNYVGDGITTANLKKKEGFIVVKFEKEGYVTLETKIFATNKRKAVSYTMRRDVFFDVSNFSGSVNEYFTVKISQDFYYTDENGKRNTELAWKMLHQVILNYFDEIQTTDMASGFIQTPWQYKTFPEADRVARTRVSVKESNIGGDLTFQIKISSEAAPLIGQHREESYREINRILKELEPMIAEFQARLGKL
jgi:hypothetical protein